MRRRNQLKPLLIGILTIQTILFLGVTNWVFRLEVEFIKGNQFSHTTQSSLFFSIQYEDHGPIIINGNTNFTAQANTENWLGEGMEYSFD